MSESITGEQRKPVSPMQTKRTAARLGALLLAPAAVASLVSCGGESAAGFG